MTIWWVLYGREGDYNHSWWHSLSCWLGIPRIIEIGGYLYVKIIEENESSWFLIYRVDLVAITVGDLEDIWLYLRLSCILSRPKTHALFVYWAIAVSLCCGSKLCEFIYQYSAPLLNLVCQALGVIFTYADLIFLRGY